MAEPSKRVKKAINALSKEELIYEIERDNKSRFSRNIPLLKLRLRSLEENQRQEERQQDLEPSRYANILTRRALWIALGTLLLAALVALFKQQ